VQGELASLRGQKKLLDDKISYSTVSLTLREVRRVKEAEPGFLDEIRDNFGESFQEIGGALRAFAVWIIGDSLYIILVSVAAVSLFFLVRSIIRRKKVKKNEEDENDTPEK